MPKGRVILTAALLLYVLAFLLGYHVSVVPRYDYFGLGDRVIPFWGLGLLVLGGIIPSFLVPTTLGRPSQLLYWAMYLLVYVPSLFILFYSNHPQLSYGYASVYAATLVMGMLVLGTAYTVRPRRFLVPKMGARSLYAMLILGACALYAYMLLGFGSTFQFVGLRAIVGQREVFANAVAGTFGGYAFAWLVTVVNPVLVAAGAYHRRWILVVLGLLGQVVLYGAGAAKGVILSVVVIPVLILLVYRWRDRFGAMMAGGIGALILLAPVGDVVGPKLMGTAVTFVVLFRALAVPGLATAQYTGFFLDHPHTYGAHITGLSSLLPYPYLRSLDFQLGEFYYGETNVGLNASTWAGDGIAGFGAPGILLASLACAALFWLLDSAAEGLDLRFSVVALAYGVLNFSNVPLFTNLVTGGVALLIVVFTLWPRPAMPRGSVA